MIENVSEEGLNRELMEVVENEALRTHAHTLIYLFLGIFFIFLVLSLLFPSPLS